MALSNLTNQLPTQDSTQPTIAIVGGGFSGVMVATHLLSRAASPIQIKIFEPKPALGRGVAYGTDFACHLLNVPAGKMSAFAQEPEHFLQWVQQQYPEVTAGSFVPRSLYGRYLQDIFTRAKEKSLGQVEWINQEVIALQYKEHQALIHLSNGATATSDRVVLALGNFPPRDPPIADPSFYQSDRYLSSFWANQQRLQEINSQDQVLIIGSGLTMIDVVMALHQQNHQGQIYVVSRRGLLPQSHQPSPAYPTFIDPIAAPKQVRLLLRLFRQELKKAQDHNWRSLFDSLRPITAQLWQQLPLVEQQRFLRHLRPYWEYHRHRSAPEIAQTIEQLQISGQLIIQGGTIESYAVEANVVKVTVRSRGTDKKVTIPAQLVINCTGSETNCRNLQQPFILNLLGTGLIQPDALGLGLQVSPTGALIGRDDHLTDFTEGESPSDWLYTLGAPCKGFLWETTAVPELRQQAETLAKLLSTENLQGARIT